MIERTIRSPFFMVVYTGLMLLFVYASFEQKGWVYPLGIVVLTVTAGLFLFLIVHNLRHPERSIKLISFIPYEFNEEDEGQQWVTNRACRKVYIFFYFAIPYSALLMVLFPFFPEVPLLILFVLSSTQYTIYWYETRRYLK
ncbi:hypothetical protein M3212_00490 [Alkalihalobacillus oceani]|uniref:hypothetical protein n=1 Tax=Halalkalibacter oceani TaxID=1653776 RepID=UPI002040C5EE|nr:hypothetical protein [Halalkalibacter oceani]MCM3759253.1 hypothetical protein [Halalkalibacter oceani]